jgi:hypothetical protein
MLMVLDDTPSRAVQKQIDELDSACKCLWCKKQCEKGSDEDGRSRGLCLKGEDGGCYWKYYGKRRSMNRTQKAQYDANLQKAGKLIVSRQGQRLGRAKTIFDEIADEVKS